MDSECWRTWIIIFKPSQYHVQSIFLDFSEWKPKPTFISWEMIGETERQERQANAIALCYLLGLPLVNWKPHLPSVNVPSSRCLARMPHTCSVSGGTHQSIWQLIHCFVLGWIGSAGHLGSVFKWYDSSCEKPREWQALAPLLLVRGKWEESRRVLFSSSQQLCLD